MIARVFFPHNQCFPCLSELSIISLLPLLIWYSIYLRQGIIDMAWKSVNPFSWQHTFVLDNINLFPVFSASRLKTFHTWFFLHLKFSLKSIVSSWTKFWVRGKFCREEVTRGADGHCLIPAPPSIHLTFHFSNLYFSKLYFSSKLYFYKLYFSKVYFPWLIPALPSVWPFIMNIIRPSPMLFHLSVLTLASSATVGSSPLEMRLRTTRPWLNFPTNYSQRPLPLSQVTIKQI